MKAIAAIGSRPTDGVLAARNASGPRASSTPGASKAAWLAAAEAARPRATLAGAGAAATRSRDAAAQLVSQLFLMPLLQGMREFPLGRTFGQGGRMEEAFGEQLDQHIADAVARADRSGLVEHVARQIERHSGAQPSVKPGDGVPS